MGIFDGFRWNLNKGSNSVPGSLQPLSSTRSDSTPADIPVS
jgi:hypothetical protein